jgi:hypothetical protein
LVQAHLQGLSPCGPPGQLEILDINELAFDNYKETENYNLGGCPGSSEADPSSTQ